MIGRNKPIAVFDIDGTIFRSSLLIELNSLLVQKKIFPLRAQSRVMEVREAWLNRQGTYADYIDTIIKLYVRDIEGKRVMDIQKTCTELIAEQRHRVYVYTRDLIAKLRKTHVLAIISFSPSEVVEEFKRVYRFSYAKGIAYESKKGVYTGSLAPGAVFDKRKILQDMVTRHDLRLKGSIGVGDTETDAGLFKLVDHPIAFNPNAKLFALAKRNHWKVVVERKDVIYTTLK